jgi:hypothetical protein
MGILIKYGQDEVEWDEISLNEVPSAGVSVTCQHGGETIVLRVFGTHQEAMDCREWVIERVGYISENEGGIGTIVIDDF